MIPLLFTAIGAYLIGDSIKKNQTFAEGGSLAAQPSKGDVVKIKNRSKGESEYLQGYSGKATVVADTPNNYGLLKVRLHREEGYTDFNDIAYYEPDELEKAMRDGSKREHGGIMAKGGMINYTFDVYSFGENEDIDRKTKKQIKIKATNRSKAYEKIQHEYPEHFVELYDSYVDEKMAKGGKIKQGKRYNNWAVTQYVPLKYNDDGSIEGGTIKLVNQDTIEAIFVQNDLALRSPKWWISYNGSRIEDKNPEVVIEKFLKIADMGVMAKGGRIHVDLFEYPEMMPEEVSAITDRYWEEFGDDMDYSDTQNMLGEIQAVGYTFDFYLDNVPYGLRPIGVELEQLKGYEEMAKGGEVGDFNYMMLGRLQSDCEYYLSYGNRSERQLWAGSVEGQIKEMKRIWHSLPEDKKPEWLSMEDILEYERKMTDGGVMAKGGSVKYYNKDNEHRISRASGSIEKDILEKVKHFTSNAVFVGNFGWKTPQGKLADGYLYGLDDYDKNLVKHLKLKQGEQIFRYLNRTTAIGGSVPFIKINIDKQLLYWTVENENDEIEFETRGTPALWIGLIEQ
jgi:hypothetical protein